MSFGTKKDSSDAEQIATWTYNALELIGIEDPASFEDRLLSFEKNRSATQRGEDRRVYRCEARREKSQELGRSRPHSR